MPFLWQDDFERTTAPGSTIGSGYTWSSYDSSASDQASSLAFVDGHVLRIPAQPYYDSYSFDLPSPLSAGYAQFDFWVPATWDNTEPEYGVVIPLASGNITVYVFPDSSGPDWALNGIGSSTYFTPTPSAWHRVRVDVLGDGTTEMRVWDVGTTMPSSPTATDVIGLSTPAHCYIDAYYGGLSDPDWALDNLIVYQWPEVSVDAILKSTTSHTGSPTGLGAAHVDTTGASSSTPVTSLSVSAPSGIANGDLLLASIVTSADSSAEPMLSGWSTVYSSQSGAGDWFKVLSKTAASEPGSYTATLSSASDINVVVSAWRGVTDIIAQAHWFDSLSPYDVIDTNPVPLSQYGMLVAIFASRTFGPGSRTIPGGWTTAIDKTDYWVQQAVGYRLTTDLAGQSDTPQATISNPDAGSPNRWSLMMLLGVSSPGTGIGADAVKRATRTGSITASAVIHKFGGDVAAGAVIGATTTGSLTSDAYRVIRTTASLTASAAIRGTTVGSFTSATAWITPSDGPRLDGVSTRIEIGGVDVTQYVVWATAEFTARVNGGIGEGSAQIVDRGHSMSFKFGQEIKVYIDGVVRWGGWLLQPRRTFPFPVSSIDRPRIWTLMAVDWNVLFDKRIVYDLAHPARTWIFPAGTADSTIINTALDFSDIDGFTRDIRHVGDGILDIPGVTGKTGGEAVAPGFTLRDVFAGISRNTAGIFYITPDKVITYCDSDLANSPYTLTDTPSGPMDIGYRGFDEMEDSTDMANDAFVWGAGYGSQKMVFKRLTSDSSVAAHGLWQGGLYAVGVYKQATVNAMAFSIVNGSPESRRGAKSPKRLVSLTSASPVFGVGDVVAVECNTFDYADVLPVREMRLTWPVPKQPRTALKMTWEPDAAWQTMDPAPPINPTPYQPGGGDGFPPGPPDPGGCTSDICGITDSFLRSVAAGLGTADNGADWAESAYPDAPKGVTTVTSVDVDHARLLITGNTIADTSGGQIYEDLPILLTDDAFDLTFEVRQESFDLGQSPLWSFYIAGPSGYESHINVGAEVGGSPNPYMYIQTNGNTSTSVAYSLTNGVWHTVRFKWDGPGTDLSVKIWTTGDPEPSSWTHTEAITTPYAFTGVPVLAEFYIDSAGSDTFFGDVEVWFRNLAIAGVNRCTAVQFDDFNRVVPSGWGTATPSGYQWVASGEWVFQPEVLADYGGALYGGTSGGTVTVSGPAPFMAGAGFTMRATGVLRSTSVDWPWTGVVFNSGEYGGYGHLNIVPRSDGTLDIGVGDEAGIDWAYSQDAGWSTFSYTRMNYLWQNDAQFNRAKVWAVGTAEPDWQVERPVRVPTSTYTSEFSIFVRGNYGNLSAFFSSIDFDYAGKPCYLDGTTPVPPPTSGSEPSYGARVTEVLEPLDNPSGGTYAPGSKWGVAIAAYAPGSTVLYIDGLLSRAYSEWDPASGQIQTTGSVPTTSVLTLSYITNGSLA